MYNQLTYRCSQAFMHNHLATKPADAVGLIHIVILGRKDEQQLLPRQHQSEPGKMKAEIPSEFVKVGYTSWPSVMHFARSRVPQYTPKDFTRTTLKEVAAIYMAKPSQGVNAVEEQFTHNVACQHGQQGRSDQQTSQKRKCSTLSRVFQDHRPRSGPADLPKAHYPITRRIRTAHHTRDKTDDNENDVIKTNQMQAHLYVELDSRLAGRAQTFDWVCMPFWHGME